MPVTYTFYRIPPGGSFPTNSVQSNFGYANDFIYMARPLSSADFPGNGTYYVQNVWTNQQTGVSSDTAWYKAVVSGSTVTIYIQDVGGNFTVLDPLYTGSIMNAGYGPYPSNNSQDFMVTEAGGYVVTENFCTAYLGTPYQTLTVPNQIDIRIIALLNVVISPQRIDPLAPPASGFPDHCAITGQWTALPTVTTNYPTGWVPTVSAPISWTIPLELIGSTTPVRTLSGTSAIVTASGGVVGTLSTTWDGTDSGGNIIQSDFLAGFTGTATVPSGTTTPPTTTTYAFFVDRQEITVCNCSELAGSSGTSTNGDMSATPVGPDANLGLSYNNLYANVAPASMGYGWSNASNIALYKDSGTSNIHYRDEFGTFLSWKFSGGTYTPSTGYNYVVLTTSASFPNYTLTFPDKSQRRFNSSFQLINDVDPRGQTVTYAYTGTHLTQITDAKGRNYYYTNNADGQVASIRALNPTTGNQTQFVYWPTSDTIAPNRLQQVITPAGDATVYYYSLVPIGPAYPTQQYQALVTAIQDPTGKIAVQYGYDALGRVVQEQWYDQKFTGTYYGTAFTVDGSNNIIYVVANAVTKIVQDLTGASPSQTSTSYYDNYFNTVRLDVLVDPNVNPVVINTTLNTYADPVNPNLLTKTVDPNLNNTSMTFDSQGNMLTYTDANSSVTTITYNAASQPLTIQRPAVTVTPGSAPITYPSTVMVYDANYNLTKITDALSNVTIITPNTDGTIASIKDANLNTASFTYYTNGNLHTTTLPAHPGDSGARVTTLGYDTYDNLNSVADALSNTLQILSDADRRTIKTTQPLLQVTNTTYVNGLITQIQYPDNQGSAGNPRNMYYSTYDSANRVTAMQNDIAVSTPLTRIQMQYDGYSNLTKQFRQQINNGGVNVNSYNFDSMGRPIANIDPLGRLTSVVYAPYCRSNQVNTARGIQRASTYDALCRLTQISTQTELRQFGYDELSRLVSDQNGGRYAWQIDPVTQVGAHYGQAVYANGRTYLHDPLDRVTQVTYSDGTYEAYTWDPVGNLLTVRDVFGQVATYTYFPDNLLKTVAITYASVTYTFTYAWDLAGRLQTITFPTGTNIVLSFTTSAGATGWDANNRLVSMRYLKSGTNIQSFVYTYDNAGNRTGMVDNNGTTTITWVYGYDWLNRLISVSKNGTATAAYAYDNSDNRATLTQGASTYSYQLDDADQLVTKKLNGAIFESYVHDADGNMVLRTLAAGSITTAYTWNDFNNLIGFALSGASQESDFYDTGGMRRIRGDGTIYETSGSISLAEQRPTSGQVSFIRGHQMLGLQEGGAIYFYLADALSSVRQVVSSTGASVATFATDEYGVPTSSTGSSELLAHTYVGGLGMRNETGTPSGAGPVANRGLYYAQQRWFDPSNGRWVSRDSIGFASGTLNLYGYTVNPIKFSDPSGLAEIYILVGPEAMFQPSSNFQSGLPSGNNVHLLQINSQNIHDAVTNGDVIIFSNHGTHSAGPDFMFKGFKDGENGGFYGYPRLLQEIARTKKRRQLYLFNACGAGARNTKAQFDKALGQLGSAAVGPSTPALATDKIFELTQDFLSHPGNSISSMSSQYPFYGPDHPETVIMGNGNLTAGALGNPIGLPGGPAGPVP